jgi:hypothetical protein
LAKHLNATAKAQIDGKEGSEWPPFEYHHLGSMALVGMPAGCITVCSSWMKHRSHVVTSISLLQPTQAAGALKPVNPGTQADVWVACMDSWMRRSSSTLEVEAIHAIF